jgi:arsenate reductase
MDKIKVLFVCVHNSARSQMAEAYLNKLGGNRFEVLSAGIEPGTLNPLAVEVMKEAGIDISGNKTKSVFEFYSQGKLFDYVISVCDEASAQRCPIFPGIKVRNIHWSFSDPASFEGTHEEQLAQTRGVRDSIEMAVKAFVETV